MKRRFFAAVIALSMWMCEPRDQHIPSNGVAKHGNTSPWIWVEETQAA